MEWFYGFSIRVKVKGPATIPRDITVAALDSNGITEIEDLITLGHRDIDKLKNIPQQASST
jgi:hypothetical protein